MALQRRHFGHPDVRPTHASTMPLLGVPILGFNAIELIGRTVRSLKRAAYGEHASDTSAAPEEQI
jgi:hypothetical protein